MTKEYIINLLQAGFPGMEIPYSKSAGLGIYLKEGVEVVWVKSTQDIIYLFANDDCYLIVVDESLVEKINDFLSLGSIG